MYLRWRVAFDESKGCLIASDSGVHLLLCGYSSCMKKTRSVGECSDGGVKNSGFDEFNREGHLFFQVGSWRNKLCYSYDFLGKLKLEKVELFMNIHCSCRATFLIPKS